MAFAPTLITDNRVWQLLLEPTPLITKDPFLGPVCRFAESEAPKSSIGSKGLAIRSKEHARLYTHPIG